MNSPDDLNAPLDQTGQTGQPGQTAGPSTGRMNDQLSGVAAAIGVDDQTMALTSVRDTVQRRRRTRQLISGAAGAAAGAVLLIGGVVVYQGLDDGDSGTIAIDAGDSETTDEEAVEEPTAGAPTAGPDEPSTEQPSQTATVPSRVVERIEAISTSISIRSDENVDGESQVEWVVPWQGGFLAARYSYASPPLPERLPEEVAALFPPEVLALFPDGLPPTIDEAMEVLSEAGLLDEVTEIISNNAAAAEAIYGVGSADQNRDVVFSADGVSWESVDIDLPEGVMEMYGVQSTGSRLAFATRIWPDVPVGVESDWAMSAGPVVVVSTVDLVNWDVVEIEVEQRPADLPDELMFNVSPTALAMNDDRWMVGLDTYIDVDIEKILPDDIRDRMGSESFGWSSDEQGVTVEIYEDVPAVTTADGSPDEQEFIEPSPTETLSFTWEELGVDPALLGGMDGPGGPGPSRIVTSLWGETPVDAASADDTWMIVAAQNGFYLPNGSALRYSADGAEWNAIALPDEVGYLSSVMAVGAGIVAFGTGESGETTVLGLADPTGPWERLEIPGAPASMNSVFGNGGSSAILVDASPQIQSEPTEITVEVDGFTLVMRNESMSMTITVTDGSGALITDESTEFRNAEEPSTWRFARSGLEILDAETGEVIVTFGNDLLEQAYQEQTDTPAMEEEYQFDMWLLASVDGERWLVEDLDDQVDQFDGPSGPGAAAISGGIVVIGSGESWQRYELN